jgi:hypothetical protein
MAPLSFDPSYEGFVPPGVVRVSPAALALGRAFRTAVGQARVGQDWLIAYDWAESRRLRKPNTNDWEDLGAGLDFAAYERDAVPIGAIQTIDALEVLIKIPIDILEASRERLIDTDNTRKAMLVLR